MKQSFLNRLINAADALDGLGRISIRLEHILDRDTIRVVVEDTGKGISPQHLDRIFLPSYMTKRLGY